ncbi:hypothetical protein QEH59_04650 [Coraliomargarita sp. SDUM461004]|uniref:Prepilin-type N-terminal cleavage/methylation domain-containing protein n=1 Tax=Thalassobacterium sedimentorum TaxID=3041258 RepID=A0ABU1AGI5_9BACT|nr:hypothetical protein [Coraliomargarita sp. SDUM461004]MDQ8193699.1 hypothetical protein [Coraliomargarita sp. SDUM461004]
MPNSHTGKQGFTVAEVLMTVLLLAAILGLVVANYFSFDGALDKRPAESQIRLAVADAHRLARTHRETIFLSYDKEAERILLTNDTGKQFDSYNFPQGSDASVHFFRILPETQFEDEASFEHEEYAVNALRFQPYGPSAPFIVELKLASELIELRFDPFSSIYWRQTDAL